MNPFLSSSDWYWLLEDGALFSSLSLWSLGVMDMDGGGMEGGSMKLGVELLDPDRLRLRAAGAFSEKRSLPSGS